MPRRPKGSVPSLVHHKPSNRARVRINGRDCWLSKWGSPESQLAYERLIAEYIANGRVVPPQPQQAVPGTDIDVRHSQAGITVRATSPASNADVPDGLTVVEGTKRTATPPRTMGYQHHQALSFSTAPAPPFSTAVNKYSIV